MSYAELHCLSCFSFQRGASNADELFEQAKQLGYAALAITDECSLAGIVRAYRVANETGLKLIVGSEVRIENGPKLVLLVPDLAAYEAMSELITRARRRCDKGQYRSLHEDFDDFAQRGLALWIPDDSPSLEQAAWVRDRFGDRAWIAVERHRGPEDESKFQRFGELSQRFHLPMVAAGDVHYHERGRRQLHDVMTSIRHNLPIAECGYRLLSNAERHLRGFDELRRLYPQELLDETLRIATRCHFRLTELKYEYPKELAENGETPMNWLRCLTEQGMRRRWPKGTPAKVKAMVERELSLIEELKYEAFFLTVAEIVSWARSKDILCQGRGSSANSAVCYALGITEIDPESGNLLFERFVSRERKEPPDIDVDFEHQRREEVIQHVFDHYGRERAAIAATVIHYRPRTAIRDVGKALGVAVDHIEALTKSLAWWDKADELPQRLCELGLDPDASLIRQWILLSNQLIGMPRHLSQHVGGFVISDRPVSHLVPIEKTAMKGRQVIQWDKDDLEELKLLKVDVLALGMLSALQRMLKMVSAMENRPIRMEDLTRDDKSTYDMICAAKTVGVFQIESRAQMSMLPRLKPRTFYDLVIEVAIVRPGPIQGGMVHPYLKRRQALEKNPGMPIGCPEKLKSALERTLGVPLFQEQVMQIAIDGAGFSPGEADRVRRSMAAWKRHGGLEHFHDQLVGGMVQNGFGSEFAESIYKMVLGFGSYGFPESHSASFAHLAYVSAWLKCHEPAAFFAGLINSQPMGFYAPPQLVQEARRSGVQVLSVDVTASNWDCTLGPRPVGPTGENGRKPQPEMRLGLRLVQGLSESNARRIETARAQKAFADLEDLVHRAQLNARDRKALADADALRSLAGHRHQARWAALGTERLPGMLAGHAAIEPQLDLLRPPREGEDIVADYASTGLTLRRHPVALLRHKLDRYKVWRASELEDLSNGQPIRVAGLVINRQRPQTAKGTVFMTLEDETGSHNLIVWDSVLKAQRRAALNSSFLIVSGELQKAEGVTHIVVRRFHDASVWLGELATTSRDFH